MCLEPEAVHPPEAPFNWKVTTCPPGVIQPLAKCDTLAPSFTAYPTEMGASAAEVESLS